jgi:hypothetical protein
VEQQEVVGELLERLPLLLAYLLLSVFCSAAISSLAAGLTAAAEESEVDVDARHGAPEMPPPPGEHGRSDHLPGVEEGEDGVDEAVRQVA